MITYLFIDALYILGWMMNTVTKAMLSTFSSCVDQTSPRYISLIEHVEEGGDEEAEASTLLCELSVPTCRCPSDNCSGSAAKQQPAIGGRRVEAGPFEFIFSDGRLMNTIVMHAAQSASGSSSHSSMGAPGSGSGGGTNDDSDDPDVKKKRSMDTTIQREQRSAYGTAGVSSLSHVDSKSNTPTMVDVSTKQVTKRVAHARAYVRLPPSVVACFKGGEITSPKGPVFATAIVAGTMGAKKASELIPFCHPLPIESCKISINMVNPSPKGSNEDMHQQIKKNGEVIPQGEEGVVVVDCVVGVHHKTGVEMEALTGASVAALTIYDMCKALSHDIIIEKVQLVSKTGGKSDHGQGSAHN